MRAVPSAVLSLVIAALAWGCSSPVTSTDASDAASADVVGDSTIDTDVPADDAGSDAPMADAGLVGERPYSRHIPSSYNPANPTPLVVLLHGYGASGAGQDLYFHLGMISGTRGFLYAYPDGTLDATGKRFWNATDACCNFANAPVDDVAYITAIIDDMSAHYNVDPHRIFLVGHSNGAFMSHRLACDLSTRVAAIVSLAGAVWSDMSRCQPTSPVSILDVHGDADGTIAYNGGTIVTAAYPGEIATTAGWAMRNGCTGTLTDTGMTIDLDSVLPGAETAVSAFTGCPTAAVELWTIHGGSHIPTLASDWASRIYDWLSAHPKP